MKLLVAASRRLAPRTARPCREGEPVWLVDPCPESLRDPDAECSCARTFSGLETDGLTAYAIVVDDPDMTVDSFRRQFWEAHRQRIGCTCSLRERMPDELLSQASSWPIGTVLERHGRRLREHRTLTSA